MTEATDEAFLRRAKIVATLGPATDDLEILTQMICAGVDVARVNAAHGTVADRRRRLALVREAARRADKCVGVLLDLPGPKIRIEGFRDGPVELVEGAHFTLDTRLDPKAGTAAAVGVAYPRLPQDVAPGDTLLLADGQIVLDVTAVSATTVETRVRVGGPLSERKGLNRQGGGISAPALSERDEEDIRFAAAEGVDYVAVSFVREADDIDKARRLVRAAGGNEVRIVAKIERHEAIDNLPGIIDASDVIMVARGDLGVEMGDAELTGLQKTIIYETRTRNKVVITATQMMESMILNPAPTRAEVSDVANAVMDGTDAVMLSAESAAGRYPLRAVEAMARVVQGAEKYQLTHGRARHRTAEGQFQGTEEAIAMAVMYTANHMKVRAIVALTESGATPLWMSRIRGDIPVYAFTPHESTRRRVTMYRGVYPVIFDVNRAGSTAASLYRALFTRLLDLRLVKKGDLVIVTKGESYGVQGGTNSMQILQVALD